MQHHQNHDKLIVLLLLPLFLVHNHHNPSFFLHHYPLLHLILFIFKHCGLLLLFLIYPLSSVVLIITNRFFFSTLFSFLFIIVFLPFFVYILLFLPLSFSLLFTLLLTILSRTILSIFFRPLCQYNSSWKHYHYRYWKELKKVNKTYINQKQPTLSHDTFPVVMIYSHSLNHQPQASRKVLSLYWKHSNGRH
jgi:hypothetical protein